MRLSNRLISQIEGATTTQIEMVKSLTGYVVEVIADGKVVATHSCREFEVKQYAKRLRQAIKKVRR